MITNNMQSTCNELERIDISLSDGLRSTAESFVQCKYELDRIIYGYNAPCLQSELTTGAFPLEGTSFFRKVFPFTSSWGEGGAYLALVPTSLTLGCSWRWRGQHLSEHERHNYLSLFTSPSADSVSHHTAYLWVRPLGLVLPSEGKNRVDFLREENVAWFPASVTECDYPEPKRIVVYTVNVHGQNQYWAVLDGRWVERVVHKDWAFPVLRAYGVSVEQCWPSNFPAVNDVAAGFDRRDFHSKSWDDNTSVDLDKIVKENTSNNTLVACSYMELRGVVRLRSLSIVCWWLGILFVSMLINSYLVGEWSWSTALANLSSMIFGASLLPFILFNQPIFHATKAITEMHWQHD